MSPTDIPFHRQVIIPEGKTEKTYSKVVGDMAITKIENIDRTLFTKNKNVFVIIFIRLLLAE